ncbi:hypothetical protein B6A09_1095 [Saccharomyces cerevisiae synthetic construct]|uniref:Putative uncharacterized protein YBR099C n=1 Tax=Saccharomyces cerevisiae (strain ATCC 204508 / S288c) TaxID=559292 RepID=YBU9_YEAST|nr:RecName: Full=Putative uncharacterized protein YBR099C [Saccharomyces cerevisiae S288C]AAS56508.1 YBR099C [Saccharomyces cerevisiae]ARB01894.1 hypothetical protein B6A09_1095 [Saccharomyces cerevisiae synthetic construct]WNV71990.1 hypothetical protein O6U65_0234 [Saccharomyces cerevisiae synthetic construct]CAA85053.1 unnamed protein product [Saccharomyces cerevisiae]
MRCFPINDTRFGRELINSICEFTVCILTCHSLSMKRNRCSKSNFFIPNFPTWLDFLLLGLKASSVPDNRCSTLALYFSFSNWKIALLSLFISLSIRITCFPFFEKNRIFLYNSFFCEVYCSKNSCAS